MAFKTRFIEPGSPWGNGQVESFNGTLQDELLKRGLFDTVLEATAFVERSRQNYDTFRPHSALGHRLPAPEARQTRWLVERARFLGDLSARIGAFIAPAAPAA